MQICLVTGARKIIDSAIAAFTLGGADAREVKSPIPYTGGGFADFLRRTDLDGKGEFYGTDIWSMRHLFREVDEGRRDRVTKLRVSDCIDGTGCGHCVESAGGGEIFLRNYLVPALSKAIGEDRYLVVVIDGTPLPSDEFLKLSFGGLAKAELGFSPEDLTERLSARFDSGDSRHFARTAIDHLHQALEGRLRAQGFVPPADNVWR